MLELKNRIEKLGYSLEDFHEELIDGYKVLEKAGIEIPDNVLSPKIEIGFFGMYCDFIVEGNEDFLQLLPHLTSGMTFIACDLVTKALKNKNYKLVEKYKQIFQDSSLSTRKRTSLARLAEMGVEYNQFVSDSFSEDDVRNHLQEEKKKSPDYGVYYFHPDYPNKENKILVVNEKTLN